MLVIWSNPPKTMLIYHQNMIVITNQNNVISALCNSAENSNNDWSLHCYIHYILISGMDCGYQYPNYRHAQKHDQPFIIRLMPYQWQLI